MTNDLVVRASRTRLMALAAGSICFVLIGVWLTSLTREMGAPLAIVGMAAVVFFGLCGWYAVRRLARQEPALVINSEGIFDNASTLGIGWIRWDEIAQMQEYEFQGQTLLGIAPKDLERLLASQPAWKRSVIRANIALGAAPINIPQVILPVKVADLLETIGQRYGVQITAPDA